MRKTITINITRRMIRKAREDVKWRLASGFCALAKGLEAAGLTLVNVYDAEFDSLQGEGKLTKGAIAFRSAFDAGRPVKPARFRLTVTG